MVSSGKVSVELFKRLGSFLYATCKMSQKVATYIKLKHAGMVKKLVSSLAHREFGTDIELWALAGGLVFSVLEEEEQGNYNAADKAVAQEIVQMVRFIIGETKPDEEFRVNVEPKLGWKEDGLDDKTEEEKDRAGDLAREDLIQSASMWLSMANANNIALEVLTEMFTAKEPEGAMETGEEELKEETCTEMHREDEDISSPAAVDEILDARLVRAVIFRCGNWLSIETEAALKGTNETADIIRTVGKTRMNAYGCLLNLAVNRSKKLIATLGADKIAVTKLMLESFRAVIASGTDRRKSRCLFERMSLFLKLSLEKLGAALGIGTTFAPELAALSAGVQAEVCEAIQLNLVGAIGSILKLTPHSDSQNKVIPPFAITSSNAANVC